MHSEASIPHATDPEPAATYPLQETAELLNDRLGLYLSPEQQRGLAAALLIGVALGAAALAGSLGQAIRQD
jgi:hypothetical protein